MLPRFKSMFVDRRRHEQAEFMLVRYTDENTLREAAAWVLGQARLSQLWAYRTPEEKALYSLFITWEREKGQLPQVPIKKLRCKS